MSSNAQFPARTIKQLQGYKESRQQGSFNGNNKIKYNVNNKIK